MEWSLPCQSTVRSASEGSAVWLGLLFCPLGWSWSAHSALPLLAHSSGEPLETVASAMPDDNSRLVIINHWPDPRAFLAGILSGLTKLAVGHPFDTIKLRIQCASPGVYDGPMDCFLQTIRKEGPRALYKGASPPAFGWALSDAVLMGSLDRYRNWLGSLESPEDPSEPLSLRSHACGYSLSTYRLS